MLRWRVDSEPSAPGGAHLAMRVEVPGYAWVGIARADRRVMTDSGPAVIGMPTATAGARGNVDQYSLMGTSVGQVVRVAPNQRTLVSSSVVWTGSETHLTFSRALGIPTNAPSTERQRAKPVAGARVCERWR